MQQIQTTGLNRTTLDKYYTKESVVEHCLKHVKSHIIINKETDLIIEPSAGNGAFIEGIKRLSNRYVFYDIEPENTEIVKQDYLSIDIDTETIFANKYKKIHIIGNPPFGRQSSLAIQFIKKSCTFCDSVSFILPKSFKKESLQKHFPLSFHLKWEFDLPEKSFLVENQEYTVESVFQIWEKQVEPRINIPKEIPFKFQFVKKTENPDISFRRVGVYAGKIDTLIDEKSEQSHYFIKFTNNRDLNENIELLKTVVFNHNNTVGPKSISKQELIRMWNAVL